ncbi:Protein kinase kin1 [Ceratocystis fimbriata CBS 114723]|uniref:non-specific serine/threonine protein kinase n=1 Tax=Ceratocystis fimbriata CBS 114723 TaxID=1035309 RepID=A0A2C5WWD0_9PEZI|nr:Protein kinase kin1 [Ceratocystis fimbriata CBS 114723]
MTATLSSQSQPHRYDSSHRLPKQSRPHHRRSGSGSDIQVPTSPSNSSKHHSRRQSVSRSGSEPRPQQDYAHSSGSVTHASRSIPHNRPPLSEHGRPHRRTSSKSDQKQHHRKSLEMPEPTPIATPSNGAPPTSGSESRSGHHSSYHHSKPSKSRTSIPTASGKWILGKTIGAGSMGKVKLARKEEGGEQVACKIIPRGSTDENHQNKADKERADQSKEIRTAREAAIVTLLYHPYICGLRDVVRTNYHWYMLFEYVNGGQMLDYIISHGKLKEKQARKFSRQIGSALDYCHRNSIVHRDLKIENILISKTGDIKIIDFGLSNLFSPRHHLRTFCGSLYFAAPELLQARAYTGPEVDIWSFGIVLYVLVCGKVPFDDQSMPALHTKIKKGVVDYPSWLSSECKHLMSRMLVTDPKQRASMQEVLTHPWMMKGYSGPPESYLPTREPLKLPLDNDVINAMTGFNFGPPEVIKSQLTRTIESEEYQRAVRLYQRDREVPQAKDNEKKRGFGFDFYRRRNSANSRDTLMVPSSEALQLGNDPLNAFSPLVSVYYLVREKQERENPTGKSTVDITTQSAKDPLMEIAPPQAAYTNTSTYEMPGEAATGGRTRPRARTHGEDDVPEAVVAARKTPISPTAQPLPDTRLEPPKKEGGAAGLLRRFSARKRREPERLDKDRSHPPVVQVHSPALVSPSTPRKSFSIRRGRRDEREATSTGAQPRAGTSQPQHSALLSPPPSAGGLPNTGSKRLGRSTSVNSAEMRRRISHRTHKEPPMNSSSEHPSNRANPVVERRSQPISRSTSARVPHSSSHSRIESSQQRRIRRDELREANVPEETDQEIMTRFGASTERLDDSELAKPVYLKGLFSVSTTSTKSVPEIRTEIKRVLKKLGVEYIEIKGGFSCRHSPSIDLKGAADPPVSPNQLGHRRRFSFGTLRPGERDEGRDGSRNSPRTPGHAPTDRSYSNSDISTESLSRDPAPSRRPVGETSTHVQSDLGGSMILEFEIFIVKVPLLSLHGIQFKRMAGNTWQYKNMAEQILKDIRF